MYEFRYFHGAGFSTVRYVSAPVVVFDGPVASAAVQSSPCPSPSPVTFTDAAGADLAVATTPIPMPPSAAGDPSVAPVSDVALLSSASVVDEEDIGGSTLCAQLAVQHATTEPSSAVTHASLLHRVLTRFVVARSLTEARAVSLSLPVGRPAVVTDVAAWRDTSAPGSGVVEVRHHASHSHTHSYSHTHTHARTHTHTHTHSETHTRRYTHNNPDVRAALP